MVRAAYKFETNKSLKSFIVKIATVLLVSLTLLLVVGINDFPGVNAPVEVRQKWAYEKIRHYPGLVPSITENNDIKDKIGQIKFVAPTKGRNLLVTLGSRDYFREEFTLEVVGEKGTGIAYITTWGGSYSTLGLCFEYQGKKTKLWGSVSSCEY